MNKSHYEQSEDEFKKAIDEKRIYAGIWNGLNNKHAKIDFLYPRIDDNIDKIEIGLSDVRASDGIRVSYDFERDGYVIEQPFTIEIDKGDFIDCVEHWEEVGFFQSWNLEHKNKTL